MTRPEARKIAKRMAAHRDFNFVRLVEDIETGECWITCQNRCDMARIVRTPDDWAELVNMEGNRR